MPAVMMSGVMLLTKQRLTGDRSCSVGCFTADSSLLQAPSLVLRLYADTCIT